VSEHVEAERLARRREAQLADARRLEAVARLDGGVAHDFNNMLTVIRTTTALLRMKATDSRTLADLAEIDQAASRATELTRQLLAFGRRHVARPRRIDLAAVVAGLTGLVSRLVGDEVQVRFSRPPAPVEVVADPGDIERVILNLAANAREAMPGGGRLELGVETVEIGAADAQVPLPAGTYARLIVHDDGNGMDDEVRLRCLDPFFTTKEGGRGAGLGLTTVHGVVAQLGGHVAVASAPGAGTRVSVYVPRAAAPARAAGDEGSPAGEVGARGLGTVLVVDDEPSVRRGIARVLRDQGYAVVETSSPAEALELYRADPGRFDLVLSDVVMPAMTGPELVERMREGGRAPRVLFVSGHAGGEHTWRLRDDDVLLVKPFSPDELSGRVRELMGPRVGPR
jgi:nitrogen-specific signal transduction histidine kinase/CheY-like chemotaxis protein